MRSTFDRELIQATLSGLPLVPRPYDALAQHLGVDAALVRERLQDMQHEGLIRRIGAVPNHYQLGYTINGMTVWDAEVERQAFQIHCLLAEAFRRHEILYSTRVLKKSGLRLRV